ncbi:tyrosine-type recombinase/integrase [Methylotuvimicrobium sp. KM1]|uniref:tyrosine-type recombinase/integrase n=1 Tax=Methylotuvimicrobium sp. KM1 TaxID=3377707 RepID=UPI00384F0C76
MAKRNSLPGLYWDKETGKGSIDKRIDGLGRVRHRFTASTWQEAEVEYHRAIAVAKTEAAAPRFRTFREAATKYLNEETKASLSRDAGCLANLDPWLGGLRLDQIHQGSIQPYIDHRREQGAKSATVKRELSVVRRILTLASRVWRDLDNQPWLPVAPLLRMPDWKDAANPHPLSFDEQKRFFRELPAHMAEMALFAVHTGAREHIVAELRWEWEIKVPELNTSIFLVPGEFTKNQTTCLLVLNGLAKNVVDSRRGKSNTHVFGFRGKPVKRMNNTAWKNAWRRAGLPIGDNVLSGPHNLRHTFARRLRLAGVPLETRKALMHHIDGDITVHYSPAEVGELLAAVEKLTKVEGVTMLRLAS